MASEAHAFDISPKEQKEIAEIYAKLRDAEAKLIGPDGKTEILPNNLYSFLLRLLADLRAGMPSLFCKAATSSPRLKPAKFSACPGSSWFSCSRRGNSLPQGRHPSPPICAGCDRL